MQKGQILNRYTRSSKTFKAAITIPGSPVLSRVSTNIKRHSQLVHVRLRYHFIANNIHEKGRPERSNLMLEGGSIN